MGITTGKSVEELAAVPSSNERRDPQAILGKQDESRLLDLVPVRHQRMTETAFTFYRGAAAVMASDLSLTPSTGILTQICGDAHLSNFGLFRSPERSMVFDINDFDETYVGPFEWDVKRLAGSMVVACQASGFDDATAHTIARKTAKRYRKEMRSSARRSGLDCWYARTDADDLLEDIGEQLDTSTTASTRKLLKKAKHRDSAQALKKLSYSDDDGIHLRSEPPLLVPLKDFATDLSAAAIRHAFTDLHQQYRKSLPDHVATVLDQYTFVEAARKVVGVGSVGTRCWIALFSGANDDPFLLQIKEAQPSVLAEYVDGPTFSQQGHRVVYGQQLMQASSDIFLGWARAHPFENIETDFYIRQLRDGKGSVVVEALDEDGLEYYGKLCGKVLAQAHARTSARHEISAYLDDAGKAFDHAIADFSVAYSEINHGDHATMTRAIDSGAISSRPLD